MPETEQLLRQKGIRATAIRTDVLGLLMRSPKAYSHADVERAFDFALDRVSVYRCLQVLTEAGLVQKLIDSRGTGLYFYEPAPANSNQPHFKCQHCESVMPLPALPDAYLAAVQQYQIESIHLLAEGTCNDCRQEATEPPQHP